MTSQRDKTRETHHWDFFIWVILGLGDNLFEYSIDNPSRLKPKFQVKFPVPQRETEACERRVRQCHQTKSKLPEQEYSLPELRLTAAGPDVCPDLASLQVHLTGTVIPASFVTRALCAKKRTLGKSATARHYLNWRTPCFLQKAMLPFISNFSNLAIQKSSRISNSLARQLEMRIPEVQLYELKILLQHWFPSPSSPEAIAKIKPDFVDISRNKEITPLALHWCKVSNSKLKRLLCHNTACPCAPTILSLPCFLMVLHPLCFWCWRKHSCSSVLNWRAELIHH